MDFKNQGNDSESSVENNQGNVHENSKNNINFNLDNNELLNDNLPIHIPPISATQAFQSNNIFQHQQQLEQLQMHADLPHQQHNENQETEENYDDFGSPSEIDLEENQIKTDSPKIISQPLPSIPYGFFLPQKGVSPIMYNSQQYYNNYNIIERPTTAMPNLLSNDGVNDFENKNDNNKKSFGEATKSSINNTNNNNYNIFSEQKKKELMLPIMPPSTVTPYGSALPILSQRRLNGLNSGTMDSSILSTISPFNENIFSQNPIKDSNQRQTMMNRYQQRLPSEGKDTIPMSAMGMFTNPAFITGSSTISPMEFNYIPPEAMMSAAGSWIENPFTSKYTNYSIPGLIPISKKDDEAFKLFKKTHRLSFSDEKAMIKPNETGNHHKRQNSFNFYSRNNSNQTSSGIGKNINASSGSIRPQVLIVDDKKEHFQYQTASPLFPLSEDEKGIDHSFFLDIDIDEDMEENGDETILQKESATSSKPQLLDPKKKQKQKQKLEPLNLKMDDSKKLLDLDEVEVDYSDAILGANMIFDSLQLPNTVILPNNSNSNNNNNQLVNEHINPEFDNLENNPDYINVLVLREKALELGLTSNIKEDNEINFSYENGRIEKQNNFKNNKHPSKMSFKRVKKPAPIKISNKKINVEKKKIDNILTKQSISKSTYPNDKMVPQYVEAVDSVVLSKSTKQVIDQIKYDALNGASSKLVSFSPLHNSANYFQENAHSSVTQPLSFMSAKNHNSSSSNKMNNLYSALDTASQLNKLKNFSPFETNITPLSSDYSHSASDILKKSFIDKSIKNVSKKTIKPEHDNNSNPVTKALQSTMNTIIKGNKKKKIKSASSDNSNRMSPSSNKITKNIFSNNNSSNKKTTTKLASNDSIKAQYAAVEKQKQASFNTEDINISEQFKVPPISSLESSDDENNIIDPENEDDGIDMGSFVNNEDSINNILDDSNHSITSGTIQGTKTIQKITNINKTHTTDNIHNQSDANKVVNKLEDIFKNKQKIQRKQLINVSTQILTSSGNLIVKSKDTNSADKNSNLNINWRNNFGEIKTSVADALLNDKNFTMEQLTKPKKGLFSCLHCTSKFSSIIEYAKHLDTIEFKRPYKCPFNDCCWKYLGMTTPAKLRRHCALQHMPRLNDEMKKILNIKVDSYPEMECSHKYCDKVFMRKDSIIRHLQMVHNNINSRFNQRLKKVLELMKNNFSHLNEHEQEILSKQYMNGSLNLPNSVKAKTKKMKDKKPKMIKEEQNENTEQDDFYQSENGKTDPQLIG